MCAGLTGYVQGVPQWALLTRELPRAYQTKRYFCRACSSAPALGTPTVHFKDA